MPIRTSPPREKPSTCSSSPTLSRKPELAVKANKDILREEANSSQVESLNSNDSAHPNEPTADSSEGIAGNMLIEGKGNMNFFSNSKNGNSSCNHPALRQEKFHSEAMSSQKSWKKEELSVNNSNGKNDTNELNQEWLRVEDYLKRNPQMLTQFVVNNVSRTQLHNWESHLATLPNCNDQNYRNSENCVKVDPKKDSEDSGQQAITVSQ